MRAIAGNGNRRERCLFLSWRSRRCRDGNYTPKAFDRTVVDLPDEETRAYEHQTFSDIRKALRDLGYWFESQSKTIDEYQPGAFSGALPALPSQISQPQGSPAAGVNFTFTNTTGGPITINGIQALFTAGANVGNRFLQWQMQDASGNIIALQINTAAVLASTACSVDAFIGNTYSAAATGTWQSTLPANTILPAGGKIILQTVILATDQWSGIVITYTPTGVLDNPGGVSTTSVILQPEYESEIIECVIVTGPPSSPFVLQLAKRTWYLQTNGQGFMIMTPIRFRLDDGDSRQLNSAVTGPWTLELAGRQNPRLRYRGEDE